MTDELDTLGRDIEITEGNIAVAEFDNDPATQAIEKARLKLLQAKYFRKSGRYFTPPRYVLNDTPSFNILQDDE